nr:aldo/keto reductase [Bradyrhizobium manausense]
MIYNPILKRDVSVIGFGCASLGSRIAPAEGLRSLEYAYDQGINWYDVAPPYGDGQAEAILGSFLRSRRGRVVICTKVGIDRPEISPFKRLLRHPARWAVRTFPGIRRHVSRARSVGTRPPLDPKRIRQSVENSLRLLQTDHLDVLALHEPSPEDCRNPVVIEELQRIQKDGLAGVVSIAGSIDSISAGFSTSTLFQGAQFEDTPFLQNLRKLLQENRARQPYFAVTHSVFEPSAWSNVDMLLRNSGRRFGLEGQPSEILIRYALANNPTGTVLLSMFARAHILENCTRAAEQIDPAIVQRLDKLIAQQALPVNK